MIINHHDNQVSVEYVADEFGFHPVGSHIPVAPPMPPHVRWADCMSFIIIFFLFKDMKVVQCEVVKLERIQSFPGDSSTTWQR